MTPFVRYSDPLSRRDWLRMTTAGVVGCSLSGWLGRLAASAADDPARRRSCILLWMNGGPSQLDTFDLKPGHDNGGPFKEIEAAPDLRISEHLPKLAAFGDRMAVIRSMSTKEADHARGTVLMHTGFAPGGLIQYPALGALVAKELERTDAEMPSFVSIAPYRNLSSAAYSPGFLGPTYAPLIVGENASPAPARGAGADQSLKVQDLDLPADVNEHRAAGRLSLLDELEQDFLSGRPSAAALSHRAAYQRAVTMMRSAGAKAFNLEEEPAALRDRYGRNLFGQGCLLARRLVERGVPFIEVTLSSVNGANTLGWDTHQDNFNRVQQLSGVLDAGWATLMADLKERGLLDSTLVVWMGEFGRTPKINNNKGRDHWANSWSTVLTGGGIKGGQAVGKTSADGMAIEERPVTVRDFLATTCLALGIDITKQNDSNVGRPIRIVEPGALPIKEVLA
jgi:uncharacterized protein (DUF1501 family)